MEKSKKNTLILVGVMLFGIIGLFVANYKSPISLVKEEVPMEQSASILMDGLLTVFPTIKKEDALLLTSKGNTKKLPASLISTVKENKFGQFYLDKVEAMQNKDENLLTTLGDTLLDLVPLAESQEEAMLLYAQAKECFEKILEINPNNITASNGLALCYIDLDQQVMKGIGLLQNSLKLDSNNVQAIKILGYLSIQSGQLKKAEKRFKKLVSLQPENPEHHFALSKVYTKQGNVKEGNLHMETGKQLELKRK